MHGYIPKAFIDRLLGSTDIIEVLSKSLPLKKAGKNYQCCCPFHHEKTPSFSVNPEKGLYHCFGCGASGNVITYLKTYENLDYIEAIEMLADMQGLDIPYQSSKVNENNRQYEQYIYECLRLGLKLYRWELHYHPDARPAVDYIKHQRGISDATCQLYSIGYASPDWRDASEKLQEKYKLETLFEAGITIKQTKGDHSYFYDRFRDRIMFPIRNGQGKVLGFGGRSIKTKTQEPKYLNTPETAVFNKSKTLYGLYEIKRKRVTKDFLLVVEGYMDVISLAEHGFQKAVATLGSAVTSEHIKKLYRETNQLIFAFDGDKAGSEAAWRALKQVLPELSENKKAYFFQLPIDQDPDSFIQAKSLQGFEEQLKQATPVIEFLLQKIIGDDVNPDSHKLASNLEILKKYVNMLQSSIYQSIMIKRISDLTHITEHQLTQSIIENQSKGFSYQKPLQNSKRFKKNRIAQTGHLLERPLQFIIQNPVIILHLGDAIDDTLTSQHSFYQLIRQSYQIIKQHQNPEKLASVQLIEALNSHFPEKEHYLLQLAYQEASLNYEQMISEAKASLEKYAQRKQRMEIKKLTNKLVLTDEEKNRLRILLHNHV